MIALTSAKGSPGVTSTALALATAWPRPVVVAECDPSGGDVVAGLLRAEQNPVGGLLQLALAARRALTPDDVLRRTVPLDESGGVFLLAGLSDPLHEGAVISTWPVIAT